VIIRALKQLGVDFGCDYEVVSATTLGEVRTMIAFCFLDAYEVEQLKGKALALSVVEQDAPRKAKVIATAWNKLKRQRQARVA